jgi:hypothetical protein
MPADQMNKDPMQLAVAPLQQQLEWQWVLPQQR